MFRNRKLVKVVAIFFILQILFDVAYPTISYALTSGPTAPEATSFEPVDTTDMVNLISGDFTYNLPLFEVPGPSGGYPLSLSYHAGINPREDASWVGLGWNVNSGAITRNVNGFADDHQEVSNVDRFFWAGGVTETYKAGVTVGLPGNAASVSAGLSFSQDTYRGFGMGGYAGAHAGISGTPLSIGHTSGIHPYGDNFSSTGLTIGVQKSVSQGYAASASVGLSTNFKSIQINANASVTSVENRRSVTDASISSKGSTGIRFLGGSVHINNSLRGNVSSSERGWAMDIPIYPGLFISVGYSAERYKIDEIENTLVNGVLYYPIEEITSEWLDTHAYDTYSLLDPENKSISGVNLDPDKVLGGSFPSYDDYSVQAQGIGGSIQPYLYQRHLFKHNDKISGKYTVKHHITGSNNEKIHFRFSDDFSNRHEYSPLDFNPIPYEHTSPLDFDFSRGQRETGLTGSDSFEDNELPGSRDIHFYTNDDIKNNPGTFIETSSTGFDRQALQEGQSSQIGGFTITNASGVKYHFNLPVYSFDEYSYSENKEATLTFNDLKKPEKYAYTWYLTAITGTDYVDANHNGMVDEEDWGYWVEFNYGKWTDKYIWRNPDTGYNSDIDDLFQNYSSGTKELYYLNSIKTKTHTALFLKEIRDDAKGVADRNIGGFQYEDGDRWCGRRCTWTSPKVPVSTLKLNDILLLKNSELEEFLVENSLTSMDMLLQRSQEEQFTVTSGELTKDYQFYNYRNVLDTRDLEGLLSNSLVNRAVRKIQFNHSYDLRKGMPNSFELNPDNVHSSKTLGGNLTLNSIEFMGKGGINLLPPTIFEYDVPQNNFTVNINGTILDDSNNKLSVGDILKFSVASKEYFCLVKSRRDNQSFNIVFLKDSYSSSGSEAINCTKTKNPKYDKNAYDIWGMFKPDIDQNLLKSNERLARIVTEASSKAQDVWSLRSIRSPLGANVNIIYEGDKYDNIALMPQPLMRIKNVKYLGGNSLEIKIHEDIDIEKYLKRQDRLTVSLMISYDWESRVSVKYLKTPEQGTNCFVHYTNGDILGVDPAISKDALIKDLTSSTIIIEDAHLVQQLFADKVVRKVNYLTCDQGTFRQPYEVEIQFKDWPDYIYAGALMGGVTNPAYGGGIRVKEINLSYNNQRSSTSYEYKNGVTSYEPFGLITPLLTDDVSHWDPVKPKKLFRKNLYQLYHPLMVNSREIPSPGVMYEKVKVSEGMHIANQDNILPAYTEYEFITFSPEMVSLTPKNDFEAIYEESRNHDGQLYDALRHRQVTLKDFTTQVASLKRITLYDESGNRLSETENHYLSDESTDLEMDLEKFNSQGVIEETFVDSKFVRQLDHTYHLIGVISKREQFPNIQTGQTNINYKTGITTTTRNLAFDFFSGVPTKVFAEDSYGNSYVSESFPAYEKYSGMGLVMFGGKNMLTQEAASYTYKVNDAYKDDHENKANIDALVSASVQTWSDQITVLGATLTEQTGIWRKKSAYSWIGDEDLRNDGLFDYNRFEEFTTWNGGAINDMWQKNNEITLYGTYSHALEAKDINGNYVATKMDVDQERVFSTATNARYHEFGYTGFEKMSNDYRFSGDIRLGLGDADFRSNPVHTGNASIEVIENGGKALFYNFPSDFNREKKYQISVWVHQTNKDQLKLYAKNGLNYIKTFTGAELSESRKAGEWYLASMEVSLEGTSGIVQFGVESSGGVGLLIDDFRFHPIDAAMTSYVYNEWGELSHILDANNIYTKYEYDGMGRLVSTYRETFQYGVSKLSHVDYKYAGQE